MALADMAGSLFVADVELAPKVGIRKLDDEASTFLELPFDEAISFFEKRFSDPERTLEVIRKYRDRSDAAGRETLQRLAAKIVRHLQSTMASGGTLREFITEFEGQVVGDDVLQAGYLENVYRSNIQAAYGAGRRDQIEQVAEEIPYIEYVTVGDGDRVRPLHRQLDGKVWRTSDPEWRQYAPIATINGQFQYQCRCAVVTRDEGEFDPSQLSRPALDG